MIIFGPLDMLTWRMTWPLFPTTQINLHRRFRTLINPSVRNCGIYKPFMQRFFSQGTAMAMAMAVSSLPAAGPHNIVAVGTQSRNNNINSIAGVSLREGISSGCNLRTGSFHAASELRRSRRSAGFVRCSSVAPAKEEGVPELAASRGATVAPFTVLITGSTKGVGLALAEEFLRNGDKVVICSRSEERVQNVVQELRGQFGEQNVWGKACDVRDAKSILDLADYVKTNLGYVDIWINNAGTNSYKYKSLVDSDDADIMEIVETNTLGVMLCCRQAIRLMRDQQRGGHIFNMDGAGADGNPTPRFAAYGATKRSLAQFTKSLQAELKQSNIQNVVVHNLSPGMVTTDLLMSGSDTHQAKFFINALAEPADTVATFLVPRIRKIVGENKNNSTYTRFLTNFKAYTQILARLLFKARKDRYVQED